MNSSLAPSSGAGCSRAGTHEAILPWLHHLLNLFPISRALVVGAGTGADRWAGFLKEASVPYVTLVEADPACFKHLQRWAAEMPAWVLCRQLIAPSRGPAAFHITTVACENGLLSPEQLSRLWPRISPRECLELDALTLADIIQDLPSPANWLFIDCFPARPILQGAGTRLKAADVIVARVTEEPALAEATMESLSALLVPLGFRLVAHEPNRNPLSGHALYVRDPRAAAADADFPDSRAKRLQGELADKESRMDSLNDQIARLRTLVGNLESAKARLEQSQAGTSAATTRLGTKLHQVHAQLSLLARFLNGDRSK